MSETRGAEAHEHSPSFLETATHTPMTHDEFIEARDSAKELLMRGDLKRVADKHGAKLAAVHDSLFGRTSRNVTETNKKYLKTLMEIANERRSQSKPLLDMAAQLA
jgi:hypothetical protein